MVTNDMMMMSINDEWKLVIVRHLRKRWQTGESKTNGPSIAALGK